MSDDFKPGELELVVEATAPAPVRVLNFGDLTAWANEHRPRAKFIRCEVNAEGVWLVLLDANDQELARRRGQKPEEAPANV